MVPLSTPLMTSFIFFLVLSSVLNGTFASSKGKATASSAKATSASATATDAVHPVTDKRSKFIFDDDVKWDCFYRSTTRVTEDDTLDPAIWRQDQYGNLLMASLTYCKGALCYNFDHRFPVSEIPDAKANLKAVIEKMKAVENCQAMSVRVNSLKGSSPEADIQNIVSKFGCDEATKNIFLANNYEYALKVQEKLIDGKRFLQLKARYGAYKERLNSQGKITSDNITKEARFANLQYQADQIAREIRNELISS